MTKSLIALLAATVMMAGASQSVMADTFQRSITVQGEASVSATPDVARIQAGVIARGDTALEAMEDASQAMNEVFAALADARVDPSKIQTSALNLVPVHDRGQQGTRELDVIGFEARNRVSVTIDGTDQLGPVLDALVSAGANDISGLSFGLADAKPAQDEARKAAVADALDKAGLYAGAAGVALGEVLSISEAGAVSPRPEMMAMARMADSAVPIAEGEVQITARVTLVIALD